MNTLKKTVLLFVAGLGVAALVGCGAANSSTALVGTVEGAAGTTSSLSLKVAIPEEGITETCSVDEDGEFSAKNLEAGYATVSIERTGESTGMELAVTLESGKTTEVEIFVMTWSPEPVGEYRAKEGGSDAFGQTRAIGPVGTILQVESDGSHKVTTPDGLVVTKHTNGNVDVDETGYSPGI